MVRVRSTVVLGLVVHLLVPRLPQSMVKLRGSINSRVYVLRVINGR